MSDTETLVSIHILDKTYPIKCQPSEVNGLQKAADHLNLQLKKLHQKTASPEAIAIVAALNISHEWIQLKNQTNQHIDEINRQARALEARLQEALVIEEEILV